MANWLDIAVGTAKVAGAVGTALGGLANNSAQVSGDPGELTYHTGDVEWTMDESGDIFAENTGEEEVNCYFSTCPSPDQSFSKLVTLPPKTAVDATEDLKYYLNGAVCVGPAGASSEDLAAAVSLTGSISFAAMALTLGTVLRVTGGVYLVVDRTSSGGFKIGITSDAKPADTWKTALRLSNSRGESVQVDQELSSGDALSADDEYTWQLEVPAGIDLEPVVNIQGSIEFDGTAYQAATADSRRLARPRR